MTSYRKITEVCFLILSLCAGRGSSHQSVFRLGFVPVALNHRMTKAEVRAVHVKNSCSERKGKEKTTKGEARGCVCVAGARKAEYKQLQLLRPLKRREGGIFRNIPFLEIKGVRRYVHS